MGARYSIAVDRVTGISTTGKYFYGGRFVFAKAQAMQDAKSEVSGELKQGYFNHAIIADRETGEEIEKFYGHDWETIKFD